MSARDRILRRDEGAPDPPLGSMAHSRELRRQWGPIERESLPIGRDVHLECRAAAESLNEAYRATVARQQHTIDVQTAWIDEQQDIADRLLAAVNVYRATWQLTPLTLAEFAATKNETLEQVLMSNEVTP